MDGSEIDVGKTNADEGYRWANTFLQFFIISVWFEVSLPSVFARELFNTMDGEHVDEEKVNYLLSIIYYLCNYISSWLFLSDPGPIIVYPSQWLTHSLTDSLTDDLVEDWMNWPK